MKDKDTKLLEEAYQDANAKQEFLGWIEAASDAVHGEIFRDYFDDGGRVTMDDAAGMIKEYVEEVIPEWEDWEDVPEMVAAGKKIVSTNDPKVIIWEYFKNIADSHGEFAGTTFAGILNSGEYSFGNQLAKMMQPFGWDS